MIADRPTCVLLVGDYIEADDTLIRNLCGRSGWQFARTRDYKSAAYLRASGIVHVVIAQSDAPTWNWKGILQDIQKSDCPPQLIVTSRIADERLWAEVLNLGGYDVLMQPLDPDEVERVIASAARHIPWGWQTDLQKTENVQVS